MHSQTHTRGDFICPYANWMPGDFKVRPMRATGEYAVDLHLHSTFSDGLKTPSELCGQADGLGLTHVALCDHDTVDGLADMAAAVERVRKERLSRGDGTPFTLLKGVELSSGRGGRTHLLGYGVNVDDPALKQCLREADEDRRQRAEKMLELLAAQGIEISEQLRTVLISPHVGRAHIARALVQIGAVKTMQQAFEQYLGEGRSAYVPRKWLETTKTVQILRNAGGVVVLAHPGRLGMDDPLFHALVEELAAFGLQGIEVFPPSASRSDVRALELFARRRGLLVTGGSDYHGDQNTRVRMGRLPAGWTGVHEDVERLLDAMRCE